MAALDGGAVRALSGTPGMHDRRAGLVARRRARSPTPSERSGFYELHLVGRDGTGERQLTTAGADHTELEWHPDGDRLVAVRGRRNRFDLVVVDAADRATPRCSPRAALWSQPALDRGRRRSSRPTRTTPRAPELRWSTPGAAPRTVHAPAPQAVRRAPHAALEEVVFPSFDGLEIPAFLMPPARRCRAARCRRSSTPTAAPPTPTATTGTATRSTSSTRATRGCAVNFRGSTGYGRDFERANHGVWGVERHARTAWPPPTSCARSTGSTATGSASSAASYGSYMALLAVDRRPRAPLPLRASASTATATS